jgi:hypothetical protein
VAVGGSIEKKTRRNENRSQWNSDSDCPQQPTGNRGLICQHLANQGQNHNDARVGMPRTEKILAQRIVDVPAALGHQRGQQKISTVLNRWDGDEDDPGHYSGFASHKLSFTLV